MIDLSPQVLSAEVKRGCRFLAVGMGGLAVDSTVFMLLFSEGASRPTARASSLMLAGVFTWLLNRAFTFDATGRSRRVELGRYGLVALGAQGFNFLLFLSLSAMSPEVFPVVLIGLSAAAAAVFSYTGQRFFTFGAPPTRST